ncbi:MAG TPA: trypsin-like peptidase domain-containing protein [Pyrinomonadaceae bacterium]|nr:trypsin-like peptidase domain-containing protein [Pyrinomonadaceae bacterium]
MTKWAWGGTGDQVMTITPEAVAAHDQKPVVKTRPTNTSPLIRMLPVVSVVLSAAVIGLLFYFLKHDPAGLSGQQVLNRFANIALAAVVLAALGIAIGVSVFYLAKGKNYNLAPSARISGVISIILATGVFGTAVFCWSRTERATSLSYPQAGTNELLQRLQNATVVIQAHEPVLNRYGSAKREGVIIANEPGRAWILTVPFLDRNGTPLRPAEMWVNLSNGRTLPGQIVWAQGDPIYLAIVLVETDESPGQIQFHPAAEGVIPGHSVLVIPNPLQGWMLAKGTVLTRASRRTNVGWNTVVKASSHLNPTDVGSAMYDESGRLLGLNVGADPNSGESQFVIIDSATASVLETVRDRKANQGALR